MKNNKKRILTTLGISIGVLSIIGISYAFWVLNYQQTGFTKVSSSCLSLSLTNEKNDINLQKAYPITDEEGKKLTPYSFTITNTCDMFASYTVNLEVLDGTTMDSRFVKSMINKEEVHNLSTLETTDVVKTNSVESRVLAVGSLGSGDTVDYTLRLWMDGDIDSNESMNQSFLSKVIVTSQISTYSPVEQGITKLSEAILANEYQTSVAAAKEKINNKQAVDFTKPAPSIYWQESHSNMITTKEVILPHPELVGHQGVSTIEKTQVILGKNYTFNKENGKYSLTDTWIVDPTAINYNDGNNYYFCSAGTNITVNDILNIYQSYRDCTTIYKIYKATKADTTLTSPNGTTFKGVKYTLEGYDYNSKELESDKSDKGLYKGTDDYGDTYYYRGSVNNNYVKFNNMYWRIIRVNGDNSIRMMYAGTTPTATGVALKIGGSVFNSEKTRPGYIGYMYGNVDGTTVDEVYANTNDSTIKTYLEDWYKANIEDKGLNNLLSDSGFCNDRTITYGDGVSAITQTNYAPLDRWNKKTPSLICPNKERDLFTTNTSAVGNKASLYPVGLITIDELVHAGVAYGYFNKLSYIYSTDWYWTMSPADFSADTGATYEFYFDGGGNAHRVWVTSTSAVRPVINLKSDVEITGGIGTANDPFVVKGS